MLVPLQRLSDACEFATEPEVADGVLVRWVNFLLVDAAPGCDRSCVQTAWC
jgi:hypothetical protein